MLISVMLISVFLIFQNYILCQVFTERPKEASGWDCYLGEDTCRKRWPRQVSMIDVGVRNIIYLTVLTVSSFCRWRLPVVLPNPLRRSHPACPQTPQPQHPDQPGHSRTGAVGHLPRSTDHRLQWAAATGRVLRKPGGSEWTLRAECAEFLLLWPSIIPSKMLSFQRLSSSNMGLCWTVLL